MASSSAIAFPPENPVDSFQVIKRDGRPVAWDSGRIRRAISLAYFSVQHPGQPNPDAEDAAAGHGLDAATRTKVDSLVHMVERLVAHRFGQENPPTIENIQDIVETCIATQGDWEVARAYVLYRARQAGQRPRHFEQNGLQDFIAISRYSRYREDLGRRELWEEAVERVRNMHLRRFAPLATARLRGLEIAEMREAGLISEESAGQLFSESRSLTDEIWEAFEQVKARRVLPSMRSLQFGGAAVESAEARIYNCSFSYADRPRFFAEAFYLLLCGVGVGFSVQKHHVARLPVLPVRADDMDLPVHHKKVADSIEGWSDAVSALFDSFQKGYLVEFDFSGIRPRGAPIKTAGGRAPGHLPLKRCLSDIEGILRGAAGRRLRPIEVYDCVMYIARAVLSGGVRRSATLCLFSPDDDEMANAKTGDWFEQNPQRAYSNNSALLERDTASRESFQDLFERLKGFGEPGFYFASDKDYGANPCVEIGLYPQAFLTEGEIARLRQLGAADEYEAGQRVTGWQMCNLSTINGAAVTGRADFLRACKHAALIGTLQAAYAHMPYLGAVTRLLNEREALLGVSICGILDNPELLLDPDVLEEGARAVRATNALFANLIGIRPAARTTCVKPEGTASLLLGAGSGIHPHHARRYLRRVQVNRIDPVYAVFRRENAHMTEKSAYSGVDDVITFPVEAPAGALCRKDLGALEFLDKVRLVQCHWVQAGRGESRHAPGLDHNVSNTVTVSGQEWAEVADYIWENRRYFTGIALLQDTGDKTYVQAPREEVSTPEDIARWNSLEYHPVDYRQMAETEDNTRLADVAACAGGACELI